MKDVELKLKKYDKFLMVHKELDGKIVITRKSPFFKKIHDVLILENVFIGKGNWVIKKLNKMDTQKYNIIDDVVQNNKRLRKPKTDRELHRDMADLLLVDYL